MAESGGMGGTSGGGNSNYILSATLQLKDMLTGKLKSAADRIKSMSSAADTARSSISRFNNQKISPKLDESAINKFNRLREALQQAGMGKDLKPININANDNATSKISKIKSQLQSLKDRTVNVAVNAKNAIGSKISNFASGAAMGMGLPLMGTAGIAYSAVDFVNTYKEFEYEMANVKALTGATDENFLKLNKRAKELGATTIFKASEVAKAEGYMALAGWNAEKIYAGLPAVLNLSAAAGEDLARVSDIVTDSMTGFGIEAGKMVRNANGQMVDTSTHFSDVMTMLMSKSNTTVGMAGEAAKYSAGVIGALYKSQSDEDKMRAYEDWALFTGLMANSGIKSSMAGTATRSLFTRLASQQMNASAAMQGMGISTTYTEADIAKEIQQNGVASHQVGQTRRARDIIGDIRKTFQGGIEPKQMLQLAEDLGGKTFTKQQKKKLSSVLTNAQKNGGVMSDADKATVTNLLAGQEALAGWLSVLMASEKDWKSLADNIDNADGAADKMSKIKMDTLEGDIKTLGSAWEAFQLELMGGEDGKGAAASGLRSLLQGLTEDVRYFQNAIKDGFDIGDIGGLLAKVATQLKDKFLAFNGVGSILAGGALVMGLKKIYDLTMKVKDAAMTAKGWWQNAGVSTQAGRQAGTLQTGTNAGSIAQSVGTMNVRAGVVNVNGKVSSTPVGQQGSAATTTGGSASRTTAPRPTPTSAPSTLSRLGGAAKIAGGASLLTALFAGLDTYSVRSENEMRVSEAQSSIDTLREQERNQRTELKSAQEAYNFAVGDPERSAEEIAELNTKVTNANDILKQTGQDLTQAESTLSTVQKDAAKYNNESLFGGIGAVGGAAAGAAIGSIVPVAGTLVGMLLGAGLGYVGSEIGKSVGDKFDFDVLGWITGKNDKTSAEETTSTSKVDWKTSNGRMFSEYSTAEKIRYRNNESAEDRASREAAEGTAQQQIAQQKHDEGMQKWQGSEFGDSALSKVSKEDISSKIEEYRKQKERERTNFLTPTDRGQNSTALSMQKDKNIEDIQNAGLETARAKIKNELDYLKSFFKGREEPATDHLGFKTNAESPKDIQEANQLGTDFWSNIKDDIVKAFTPQEIQSTGGQQDHLGFEMPEMKMPEFNFSQWWSEQTAGMEMPDFSQMWADFNVNDFLPDVDISGWFNETFANIEMPDISSMLPDFSSLGATISESLSSIPTAASEAFSTISTAASEGWTTIQTEWSQLPSFFDGLWAGAGSAASAAGSAIASGINSAIGTIQSSWEGLSSWLSSKISSLASMASNAASSVMGFFGGGGSIGHNASGTSFWSGGWTEINEHGGEIFDLPQGTRIYPHATTMKMLKDEMQNGTFNDFLGNAPMADLSFNNPLSGGGNFLSNVNSITSLPFDNSFNGGELLPNVNGISPLGELPAMPQMPSFEQITSGISNNSSNSTTNNNTSSNMTFTGDINITNPDNFDSIVFELMKLMGKSSMNFGGVGL